MKKRSSFLSVLLLSICISSLSLAQVYISGPLSGVLQDTTYIVTGDISVEEGDSLIIQPGAIFFFDGYYEFDIYGYLCAAGIETDSIKFMPNAGYTFWDRIDFNDSASDSSILEYCFITGAHWSGVRCDNSSPTIRNCTLHDNYSVLHGGGICCSYSDAIIENCVISENSCFDFGGGISCYQSSPLISNCEIRGNFGRDPYGYGIGGGIHCRFSSHPTIKNCLITENRSRQNGGGIGCVNDSHPLIFNCTIVNNDVNQHFASCGGVSSWSASSVIQNCIVWGNTGEQVYGEVHVTYCDIQGGWPGLGNIDEDPLFVGLHQGDFRLQWGSPCIDSGNPDPQYNDPDGTRADMGAFYYDQSIPVRVLLTPHNLPIAIPPEGGSFNFSIQATNIDSISHQVDVWCDVILPNGQIVGPVLGPVSIEIGSEVTISRDRTQAVPANAPVGLYFYNAHAVVEVDTSTDSFVFYKQGTDGGLVTGGWPNWGEDFGEVSEKVACGAQGLSPSSFFLFSCSPNPFNPTATIRFELPVACFVKLEVFDISGRIVGAHGDAPLLNGWREAGLHGISFNGSKLPSGVYIARLEARSFRAARKLVLVK